MALLRSIGCELHCIRPNQRTRHRERGNRAFASKSSIRARSILRHPTIVRIHHSGHTFRNISKETEMPHINELNSVQDGKFEAHRIHKTENGPGKEEV